MKVPATKKKTANKITVNKKVINLNSINNLLNTKCNHNQWVWYRNKSKKDNDICIRVGNDLCILLDNNKPVDETLLIKYIKYILGKTSQNYSRRFGKTTSCINKNDKLVQILDVILQKFTPPTRFIRYILSSDDEYFKFIDILGKHLTAECIEFIIDKVFGNCYECDTCVDNYGNIDSDNASDNMDKDLLDRSYSLDNEREFINKLKNVDDDEDYLSDGLSDGLSDSDDYTTKKITYDCESSSYDSCDNPSDNYSDNSSDNPCNDDSIKEHMEYMEHGEYLDKLLNLGIMTDGIMSKLFNSKCKIVQDRCIQFINEFIENDDINHKYNKYITKEIMYELFNHLPNSLPLIDLLIKKYPVDSDCLNAAVQYALPEYIEHILKYKIIPEKLHFRTALISKKHNQNITNEKIRLLCNWGYKIDLDDVKFSIINKKNIPDIENLDLEYDEEVHKLMIENNFFPNIKQNLIDNNLLTLQKLCYEKINFDKIRKHIEKTGVHPDKYCLDGILNTNIIENLDIICYLVAKGCVIEDSQFEKLMRGISNLNKKKTDEKNRRNLMRRKWAYRARLRRNGPNIKALAKPEPKFKSVKVEEADALILLNSYRNFKNKELLEHKKRIWDLEEQLNIEHTVEDPYRDIIMDNYCEMIEDDIRNIDSEFSENSEFSIDESSSFDSD